MSPLLVLQDAGSHLRTAHPDGCGGATGRIDG